MRQVKVARFIYFPFSFFHLTPETITQEQRQEDAKNRSIHNHKVTIIRTHTQ